MRTCIQRMIADFGTEGRSQAVSAIGKASYFNFLQSLKELSKKLPPEGIMCSCEPRVVGIYSRVFVLVKTALWCRAAGDDKG